MEFQLWHTFKIRSMSMNFETILQQFKLDKETHVLTINSKEIGMIYYSYGYCFEDYGQNDQIWNIRGILEISQAVKCPSVDF